MTTTANSGYTAHGKPVDNNMMKLIQGYLMAVLVGNDAVSAYFAERIQEEDLKKYLACQPCITELPIE